jgi:hypothetical protein
MESIAPPQLTPLFRVNNAKELIKEAEEAQEALQACYYMRKCSLSTVVTVIGLGILFVDKAAFTKLNPLANNVFKITSAAGALTGTYFGIKQLSGQKDLKERYAKVGAQYDRASDYLINEHMALKTNKPENSDYAKENYVKIKDFSKENFNEKLRQEARKISDMTNLYIGAPRKTSILNPRNTTTLSSAETLQMVCGIYLGRVQTE